MKMTTLKKIFFTAGLTFIHLSSLGMTAQTKVTWHGHAAFEITTPNGIVLMIDPWLNNPKNPAAGPEKNPVELVNKLDYILITHGHSDHVGDAPALAKKTGARLITNVELGGNLAKLYDYPKEQMGYDTLMNIGGRITIGKGEVEIFMTPAVHSSGLALPNAKKEQPDVVYGGNPAGFIVKIKNGPTIYHTGDTAYFRDMEEIGEQFAPDLALINMGGHFGMQTDAGAKAAKAVRAKLAVPHHYGTFPVLTQAETQIILAFDKEQVPYKMIAPGTSLTFENNTLVP